MKQTNNFYPKTRLKKFGNLSFTKTVDDEGIEYVITDERGCYTDIIVDTNKHYKITKVSYEKGDGEKLNIGLLVSLSMHKKKGGLIAR